MIHHDPTCIQSYPVSITQDLLKITSLEVAWLAMDGKLVSKEVSEPLGCAVCEASSEDSTCKDIQEALTIIRPKLKR
jgi:hypothetical protein